MNTIHGRSFTTKKLSPVGATVEYSLQIIAIEFQTLTWYIVVLNDFYL